MLQYDNWTDKQGKTECFRQPVGHKSILKIIKLAKMAYFSVESGSESGSSFIRPVKESECYTDMKFHEILLKTHCLVKFESV